MRLAPVINPYVCAGCPVPLVRVGVQRRQLGVALQSGQHCPGHMIVSPDGVQGQNGGAGIQLRCSLKAFVERLGAGSVAKPELVGEASSLQLAGVHDTYPPLGAMQKKKM